MKLYLTSSPTGPHRSAEKISYKGFNPQNDLVENLKKDWAEQSRCLFISADPDAYMSNNEMRFYFEKTVRESGLSVSVFDVCDRRNTEEMKATLLTYDMIILGGGHVPTQNTFLHKSGLMEVLRQFDGIVMGISAGTMNCAECVYAQPELPGESESSRYHRFLTGIGYTRYNVLPHYQTVKDHILDGRRLMEEITYPDSAGKEFYALTDGSYIYCQGGTDQLFGEAYLISDGTAEQICKDGEMLTLTSPHGGDIYRNSVQVDFSVNTNPLGPQPEVLEAVRRSTAEIDRYPDIYCESLVEEISQFEQVSKSSVLCGNGAAELFFLAVLAVKPRKALLLAPAFSEYERALRVIDTEIVYYELKKEDEFKIGEDLPGYITEDTDMVFLCNPNNPTGQTTDRRMLEKIAGRCRKKGAVLVVDECFIDFLDDPWDYTMKGKMDLYPNMIIIKAFTKLFAVPGLRLGYAMSSNRRLLERMKEMIQPWNVSVPAQNGGIAAMQNCSSYIEKMRREVKKERQFLIEELKKCECTVYGSKANFIFFRSEKDIYYHGLKNGYLVRDCSNYRGLEKGYYRIAVKNRQDNERLTEWLKQL